MEQSVQTGRQPLLLVGCALWGVALTAGAFQLARYEGTPGSTGAVATRWPDHAAFRPGAGGPTLVMFLHPHCPCSRATIEQLNRLLVRKLGRVEVFAVFVLPADKGSGWEQTDQWRSVSGLPGVQVIGDEGGRTCALFGAALSGEMLLYRQDGRLTFHGGITPARGHAGDNPGSDALAARIDDPGLGLCSTKVFGCPLSD